MICSVFPATKIVCMGHMLQQLTGVIFVIRLNQFCVFSSSYNRHNSQPALVITLVSLLTHRIKGSTCINVYFYVIKRMNCLCVTQGNIYFKGQRSYYFLRARIIKCRTCAERWVDTKDASKQCQLVNCASVILSVSPLPVKRFCDKFGTANSYYMLRRQKL